MSSGIKDGYMFESCAILNGGKTKLPRIPGTIQFESCVILNGGKPMRMNKGSPLEFESCVILDGSKADHDQL